MSLELSNDRIRARYKYSYSILCREMLDPQYHRAKPIAPFPVQIVDISYSGIGLTCNTPLKADDVYMLNFKKGDLTRKITFKIMWMKKSMERDSPFTFRVGCHFINVTKDDVLFIHEIITSIK